MEWHQAQVTPFDDAEFYDLGTMAFVSRDGEIIEIDSEGERDWRWADRTNADNSLNVQEPEVFRDLFWDGKLPSGGEDGWAVFSNGWFALYRVPLVADPEAGEADICYLLAGAIGRAVEMLGIKDEEPTG